MNKNLSPQELAEQWCSKHPEVVSASSENEKLSAMDKAIKIISLETSTDKGKSDLFRAAAPFGVSFLDSIPGQPHPATDFLGARDLASSSSVQPSSSNNNNNNKNSQQQQQQQQPSGGDTMAIAGAKASNLQSCPYCKEPTSRFCKETGRRHETPEEKANRRWKHIFRQYSLASSFVSNVRLSKKNTCLDQEAVELVFD